MKKISFACSFLFATMAQAQFVNNGATIVIQPGGSIFCTGNFTNASGTITNNGKIEVQGNFANNGTYNTTTSDDSLIMSGSGNATLNSGGSALRYLTINKTSNADLVTLAGTLVIDKLDYLSGVLSTDYLLNPSYSLTAPTSAVFNFAAGREIVGNVKRTGWSNGSTITFNSAAMKMTTSGGTAPTELTVTMLPGAYGGNPSQLEREVTRKFLFSQSGGSGFTSDIQFAYAGSELNTNAESNLVPWNLVTFEWNARFSPVSRDGANDWVSTTGIDEAAFNQEWKLADPKYTLNVAANLRGSWNGADMNASIISILPTSQPYNTAPFNYTGTESVGAIPNANVVDWVLVELRKPATGLPADATSAAIIGRKAGFLLRNGTVVDPDGFTPIGFDIAKQGASFITIRHRNHLGVMSNSIASNIAGTFANNFSLLANSYKAPGASSDPVVALPSGSAFGLWAGDANKSGSVNGTDVSVIKNDIASTQTGYRLTDVNLSNSINGTDVTITKNTVSNTGGGSAPNRIRSSIKSNLPETKAE